MPFVLIVVHTMAVPRSWLSISYCRYRFQYMVSSSVAIGINCCLLDYPILVAAFVGVLRDLGEECQR